MGYEPNFPANQLGGQKILWVIVEYGLSGIWVRRESTVNDACIRELHKERQLGYSTGTVVRAIQWCS